MSRAISLAPLTATELTPPELVSCAAQAGYSHVGLRVIKRAADPGHPMLADRPMVRETERRLAAEGVRAMEIEVVALDGQTKVAACEPSLETAARLGGQRLVVVADDPEPGRLADDFAALCQLAGRYGLTADIEPVTYNRLATVAQAAKLIRASGAENAGVLLDPLHFYRSQNSLEDVAALARSQLHLAQVCDAPAEPPPDREGMVFQARHARLLPGEGGLDLLGLLRVLPADLPVSVEIPLAGDAAPLARARAALKATRRLLEQV